MLIEKTIEIDLGHRVPNHKSKCRNLHGHRYKIEVGVDDKVITESGQSDEGMVIDFSDLKEIMMQELDAKFDHGFVMYEYDILYPIFLVIKKGGYILEKLLHHCRGLLKESEELQPSMKIVFVPFIPTAENLAKHWYELMKPRLVERNIKIKHVKVWETPTSTATYTE